jgi:GntR family transcriptional regulator
VLAVGTVARAYRELEQAGLVYSRRGAGTRVALPALLERPQRRHRLQEHADAYVHLARRLGADDRELLQAIRLALSG